MQKIVMIGILVLALASTVFAQGAGNTFVSGDLGFSMEVPVSTTSDVPAYQIAMFFLTPSDGFTANVNVIRQIYGDTLGSYDKMSTDQFASMNLTVLSHTITNDEITYEYQGDIQGKTLHWYARAIKRGTSIYLVTATCLDSHWEEQKAELMRSVDSFKAD